MHLPSVLAVVCTLYSVADARVFRIPVVEAAVQKALKSFPNYKAFTGPFLKAPKPVDTSEDDVSTAASSYWLENIAHQGRSPFGPAGYTVFRNVKDFGARGDGVTDDTAAIQAAIASQGRCGRGCVSSTVTPAIVYFPAGTYMVSNSIVDYYYTMLIGDANNLPVIKATAGFNGGNGGWMIDGDPYYTAEQNWLSTTVFWRQIKNFVFDISNVAPEKGMAAVHWPTAQATSIQNVVFRMSSAAGTKHEGLFIENGSAGMLMDLTFYGGNKGAAVGNQQFTMRNLTFYNSVTALSHFWDWGWTYKSLNINNCQVGIDISAGGPTAQDVGSIVLLDSTISNTPIGIKTSFTSTSQPPTAGSLIMENVQLNNVPVAVQNNGATALNGGTTTIAAWGQGHRYNPTGPNRFSGPITPSSRPASLLVNGRYLERAKPAYNNLPVSSFRSVRTAGARGDAVTDDTNALQNVINSAASQGQVVWFDHGTYRITRTLFIPPGSKIVGEAYPIILSSGSFWGSMSDPQPVVKVANPGETGLVEWSDMIVSTQGAQPGATLIQWNLATSGTPSGMWDVHARVGGFPGSNLSLQQCPKTPGNPTVKTSCIGGYMLMHITPQAMGVYLENTWFWTADHDLDSGGNEQITVYVGRGLLIDSTRGNIWLSGTSVEHNVLYQYQLVNTKNIYMGHIQTETPYYQPVPNALVPFPPNSAINDPNFSQSCAGQAGNCAAAWGLRIVNSNNIFTYGAGLYSFFTDYSTTCSNKGGPSNCQNNIFSVEGNSYAIPVYGLSTVGTTNMITRNGATVARYSDNQNNFNQAIAWFTV
jgi:glucan 1,3-beta-glucosidase